MKNLKKTLSALLLFSLIISIFTPYKSTSAKNKIALSQTSVLITTKYKYCSVYLEKNGNSIWDNVKWESSNPKVVTVKEPGDLKPHKKGNAVITATYKNKKYKCSVKVVEPYNIRVKAVKTYNTKIQYTVKNNMNKPLTFHSNCAIDLDFGFDGGGHTPGIISGNSSITIQPKKSATFYIADTQGEYGLSNAYAVRIETDYNGDKFMYELPLKKGKGKFAGSKIFNFVS